MDMATRPPFIRRHSIRVRLLLGFIGVVAVFELHGANAKVVRQGDVLSLELETLLNRLRAA